MTQDIQWQSSGIDQQVAKYYDRAGWTWMETGGGCNYPALLFGPVRQDSEGNDAYHLIMVGTTEDVGSSPDTVTQRVTAVLYDQANYGLDDDVEYMRDFDNSTALIDHVAKFDLTTTDGLSAFLADWVHESWRI
jgi:hypothetical protein